MTANTNFAQELDDIDMMLLKQSRQKRIITSILPYMGLVLTIVLLTIATNGLLLSSKNLVNIMNQSFTVLIVGLGASFVYARGGIDFSLGPSSGVAQLVCVAMITRAGLPVWMGVIAATAVAVINTMIVGLGADYLHLQPFIVSLCVRTICVGILQVGCNALGKNIHVPMSSFGFMNNDLIKGIVLLILLIVCWFMFERTGFGKELKAMGGNLVTAVQSGVRSRKNVAISHLMLGICVGISACFQMARAGNVTTQSGSGLEFDVMIALALGGFPMSGGASSKIRSTIIGVLTVTFLSNGLTLAGVDNELIRILKGLLFIVIVAVSYDRSQKDQQGMSLI
jgi:ribose transport system permease protein